MTCSARLAIVGDGPRSLWALERLDAHLDNAARAPSVVEVFGVGELGAGSVYDTTQPDYLRLNIASSTVDVWLGRSSRGPSLDEWREAREPGSSADAYPARALAGRYLGEQAVRVITSLRGRGCAVIQHRERVSRLSREHGRWAVPGHAPYDEALLAVGHTQDWGGALRHRWHADLPPLVPGVFPAMELSARPELRSGATVVVRGAALTAIDALLAMTLGRGRHPADSDVRVVMTSRTGRLMRPKTHPDVLEERLSRTADLTDLRAAVNQGQEIPTALMNAAIRLLGDDRPARSEVATAVAALFAAQHRDTDPVESLSLAVSIARGESAPDGAWALGQAWRLLYPDLVRRQRRVRSGSPLGWPAFHGWAVALERLAFGPPLANAELLLQGMIAGAVEVSRSDVMDLAREADLVVDAVLPPPGIADLQDGDLLHQLRQAGTLSRDAARRGASTAPDASVIDTRGEPVRGLAIIGRATEDDVLGNDTLLRALHPEIERWARRVLSVPATRVA